MLGSRRGFEELTWDLLLHLIDQGEVVPIVGQDLLTWPGDERATSLYTRLAEEIAGTLRVSADDLPEEGALNEVAYRFVRMRGNLSLLYPALWRAMAHLGSLPVPGSLEKLTGIIAFKLFVTTTFDRLLVRALEKTRPDDEKPQVFSYTPRDPRRDIPEDWESLRRATVYHLLGQVQPVPNYALTEEDTLEFVHALQSETRRPQNLFAALHSKHLLVLGCSFPDWLARFFLRIGTADQAPRPSFVADRIVNRDPALRDFLRHYSRQTWIFEGSQATEFVDELSRRWQAREQPATSEFVFLSYAKEDRDIALTLRDTLRAAQVETWLDLEEVQGGDAWKAKIQWAIQKCRLFVPILTANVFTTRARYFRFEWDQALQQRVLRPWERPFIVPMVSQEVSTDDSRVPDEFRSIHWLQLRDQALSPDEVPRLKELIRSSLDGS